MPFITRADGERFVIPSYRDTISAKKPSLLKKEVVLLSTSYGEYVALQKKSPSQYEVAFSPDSGYLLGECVWSHFKRPPDMIYCEEIPNTSEAILVIVKSGSVYLDGSFQLDSIAEELLIFKTQKTNFAIFVSGDVPLSEVPEVGKFAFDSAEVKSFTVLPEPIFPTLGTVKAFQLMRVDDALKALGVGALPIVPLAFAAIGLVVLYMGYSFLTRTTEVPTINLTVEVNPYQGYLDQLASPDPSRQLIDIAKALEILYVMPGWKANTIDYIPGTPYHLRVAVSSLGGSTSGLMAWGKKNNIGVAIQPDGTYLDITIPSAKRNTPDTINSIQDVISAVLDRYALASPGNGVQLSQIANHKEYSETNITAALSNETPLSLMIIAQYFQGLPLVLTKMSVSMQDGYISGSIILKALGN